MMFINKMKKHIKKTWSQQDISKEVWVRGLRLISKIGLYSMK